MKQSTLDTITSLLFLGAMLVALAVSINSLVTQQRQFKQLEEIERQMDESDERRKAIEKELEDANAKLKTLGGKP